MLPIPHYSTNRAPPRPLEIVRDSERLGYATLHSDVYQQKACSYHRPRLLLATGPYVPSEHVPSLWP